MIQKVHFFWSRQNERFLRSPTTCALLCFAAFPCATQSATDQANSLVSYLHSHKVKFGQVWIDVETNPSPGSSFASERDCGIVLLIASASH